LLGQSDNNLEELRSKDTAVFDPTNAEYTNLRKEFEKKEDKRPMYGVMREMLMRHYMGNETVEDLLKILKKFKVEEPATGDKRKRDDDDDKRGDDDSNGGGPDNSGNKGKRTKHGKGGPGGGSGGGSSGGGGPGTKVDGSGGSAGKHTKPQDFQTIANEDIDFLSMEVGHVWDWRLKVTERSIINLDFLDSKTSTGRARARLHRAFNGKFTEKTLDKDTALIWREKLKMNGNFGYGQILGELILLTYNVSQLPRQLEWYPDYYLLKKNITPAKDNNKEGAAARIDHDPKHDDGPLDGNSSGGNNGPTGLLPINTSNTISSKRKHEGDSDSAIKKPKLILNPPSKMPVSEDDESTKEDDAKNNELEDDDAEIIFPNDVEEEEEADNNELVNDDAENTFDDVEEEEDAPGWNDAFVSSPPELSSPSELSDD
jgi:hypothetical protein